MAGVACHARLEGFLRNAARPDPSDRTRESRFRRVPRTVVNGDDVRQCGIEGQFVWRPLPQTSLAISAAHLDGRQRRSLRQLLDFGAAQHRPHAAVAPLRGHAGTRASHYHQQSDYNPLGVGEAQPGSAASTCASRKTLASRMGDGRNRASSSRTCSTSTTRNFVRRMSRSGARG